MKQNRKEKQHLRSSHRKAGKRNKKGLAFGLAFLISLGALLGGGAGARHWLLPASAQSAAVIAHYVNRKDALGTDKDGSVHTQLQSPEEHFVFDFQAYIPEDAVKLIVTDQLNQAFSFAEPVIHTLIQEGEEAGGMPLLSTQGEGVPTDALTLTAEEQTLMAVLDLNGLTKEVADSLRGKWLQIGFEAKINEVYTTGDAGLCQLTDIYRKGDAVNNNAPVEHASVSVHKGLTSFAECCVVRENGTDEHAVSNVVTVSLACDEVTETKVFGEGEEKPDPAVWMEQVSLHRIDTLKDGEDVDVTELYQDRISLSADPDNGNIWILKATDLPKVTYGTRYVINTDGKEELEEASAASQNAASGNMTIEGVVSFTNESGKSKPEAVELVLYQNQKEFALITLTEGGMKASCNNNALQVSSNVNALRDWVFTIEQLDALQNPKDAATAYAYTIKAKEPEGYTITYGNQADEAQAGNGYTMILGLKDTKDQPEVAGAEREREETISAEELEENSKQQEEQKETTEEEQASSKEAKQQMEATGVKLYLNDQQSDVLLRARDDLFSVTIELKVPKGAKSITITDTLEAVLKLNSTIENISVLAGGVEIAPTTPVPGTPHQAVTLDGQVMTIRIPDPSLYEEKTLLVRFEAFVRSDMDLAAYGASGGKIPHSAKVIMEGDEAEPVSFATPVRFVQIPEKPGVTKNVNDTDHYVLSEETDDLNYVITARIPRDAVSYTLVDAVPQVLEIKSAKVSIGGRSAPAGSVKTQGHEVSLILRDATELAGETVEMTVKATVLEGADLSLFQNYKVPNTVTILVNGRLYETSEPATVDGEVLGVRTRGGKTGEAGIWGNVCAMMLSLLALVILMRKPVRF